MALGLNTIRLLRFIGLDRRDYFGPLDLYSRFAPYKSGGCN